MVSRPVIRKASYQPDNANSAPATGETSADEEKRLAEKFLIHRRLVPLVSQNEDVLFLNAASAPPSNLIVHEAITKYSADALYGPHPHPKWRETKEDARRLLARVLNAEAPETIAFTRDTTEGLGSFIRAAAATFRAGDNVVVVDNEHPNLAYGFLVLRDAGVEVRQVPTIAGAERTGRVEAVTAETLRPFVDERTRAIGISSISFDGGQFNDVKGICAAFRHRGIHVLADVSQHVGIARIDAQELRISAAAFSLHKGLNCPTGIGALYVSPAAFAEIGDPIPPIVNMAAVRNMNENLIVRADEPVDMFPDARRFEHANMSLAGVVAAAAFTRFYLDVLGPADVEAHLYNLTDFLGIECDRLGIKILSPRDRDNRAPHICILKLDQWEWAPYVKGHEGAVFTVNRLGIRVSFGFFNSFEDVRRLVQALEQVVARGLHV
ncbi:PLP-dependent transferase [Hypoxylon trugodes]|uniref:PLP-dependent transferase n=1 Tax=Hypoxylon trugodes TaxID=326681 RepID=UPI00219F16C8|nr:PLP-dependent transferase [Hypoxylon trugodes]KAI1385354.1 PLP-dependent transferase [Hypoxylon trugodes]